MDSPLTVAALAEIPLGKLHSVPPKKVAAAATVGIDNVAELLMWYPRRYIDRSKQRWIADLSEGDNVMVLATIARISSRKVGRRTMVEGEARDRTGSIRITFFNQPWRTRQLAAGTEVVLFGKVDSFRGRMQMTNPLVDLVGDQTGRIVAVYPQSDKAGLTSAELSRWIGEALERTKKRGISDPVPEAVRDQLGLIGRDEAVRAIHMPESSAATKPARDRLVFDELLRMQLVLVDRKRELERSTRGVRHDVSVDGDESLVRSFWERLPFPLTGAQRRCIDEILADLAHEYPMHRLLQGDVGSGKTVVAVSALLASVQGGHQGALMAPTEVLAEQHWAGVRALLEGIEIGDPATLLGSRPIRVALLSQRLGAADRREILAGIADGSVDIAVGTHALIQDAVTFRSLGLAVVDEQHRFGVEQRSALRENASSDHVPDLLVMTATPIPRTAAMTVYGDLDVSVLDELPPGRTPITTTWAADESAVAEAWELVRAQVEAGHQVYVVCPLIDESEKLEVAAAETTKDELEHGVLYGLRLGLLHGRMPTADKDATMAQFRAGKLDVLVATTVIEVGVDVPNASVMVILDADRFGIAQLHQLRGRVGRGAAQSFCVLVATEPSPDAEVRLGALCETTDGFALAEVDLDLRGEGTLMGERQTGRNDLRLASLRKDGEWVRQARKVAHEMIGPAQSLADYPELASEIQVTLGADDAEFLAKS